MADTVPPPSRTGVAAVLFLAVAGGVVSGLQPLLLGALSEQGRIAVARIGQAATLEACGMGLAVGLAGARLKPERLRAIALATALVAASANFGTMVASGRAVLVMRGVAGLCSGLLLWLGVGLFARAANPARLFGIYVTALSIASLLLAWGLSSWLIPRYGADGGYAALAVFDLIVAVAAGMIPRRYGPLPRVEGGGRLPPARGLLALAAVFLHLAGVMALWVYVVPLVRRGGAVPRLAEIAVLVTIGAQIAGGIAAAMLAGRFRPTAALLVSLAASLLAVAILATSHAAVPVLAAVAVFGFCWMFAPPFQMPFLIASDPSRRAAMLIGSAQLFGSGAGPMIASWLVIGSNVALVPLAPATLFSVSVVLVLGVGAGRAGKAL